MVDIPILRRYWRLVITADPGFFGVSELHFYDRNVVRVLGGTAFGNTNISFSEPSKAFDNNVGTQWLSDGLSQTRTIGYDFLVPTEIFFVKLVLDSENTSRFYYDVEHSVDGINWVFSARPFGNVINNFSSQVNPTGNNQIDVSSTARYWRQLYLGAQNRLNNSSIKMYVVEYFSGNPRAIPPGQPGVLPVLFNPPNTPQRGFSIAGNGVFWQSPLDQNYPFSLAYDFGVNILIDAYRDATPNLPDSSTLPYDQFFYINMVIQSSNDNVNWKTVFSSLNKPLPAPTDIFNFIKFNNPIPVFVPDPPKSILHSEVANIRALPFSSYFLIKD